MSIPLNYKRVLDAGMSGSGDVPCLPPSGSPTSGQHCGVGGGVGSGGVGSVGGGGGGGESAAAAGDSSPTPSECAAAAAMAHHTMGNAGSGSDGKFGLNILGL